MTGHSNPCFQNSQMAKKNRTYLTAPKKGDICRVQTVHHASLDPDTYQGNSASTPKIDVMTPSNPTEGDKLIADDKYDFFDPRNHFWKMSELDGTDDSQLQILLDNDLPDKYFDLDGFAAKHGTKPNAATQTANTQLQLAETGHEIRDTLEYQVLFGTASIDGTTMADSRIRTHKGWDSTAPARAAGIQERMQPAEYGLGGPVQASIARGQAQSSRYRPNLPGRNPHVQGRALPTEHYLSGSTRAANVRAQAAPVVVEHPTYAPARMASSQESAPSNGYKTHEDIEIEMPRCPSATTPVKRPLSGAQWTSIQALNVQRSGHPAAAWTFDSQRQVQESLEGLQASPMPTTNNSPMISGYDLDAPLQSAVTMQGPPHRAQKRTRRGRKQARELEETQQSTASRSTTTNPPTSANQSSAERHPSAEPRARRRPGRPKGIRNGDGVGRNSTQYAVRMGLRPSEDLEKWKSRTPMMQTEKISESPPGWRRKSAVNIESVSTKPVVPRDEIDAHRVPDARCPRASTGG